MSIQVQIYGTQTVEDAMALAEMGVDFLGLEMEAGEGEEQRVAAIMEAVRGKVARVLLPLLPDLDAIVAAVHHLRPDVVHLCVDIDEEYVKQVEQLVHRLRPAQVMQAIPVAPPGSQLQIDSVALARIFDPHVDYLLLDTKLGRDGGDPVPGWIGVTGQTHDWSISRAIVESCETPVILAGGLNPDNVGAAITEVHPWGVDANTGLNQAPGKKDLDKCRAFIENAKVQP